MPLSPNASSITALATASTLIESINGLLLASPQTTQGYQPQNPPTTTGLLSLLSPPPGILFHYEGEQTAALTSDITDHFIEDNTAIEDQIALKPIVITTHGFIGELNNIPPPALALLQQATNNLVSVGSYLPGLSITAQLAYDSAFATYQLAQSALNSAISAISSIAGNSGESVIGSIIGNPVLVSNQNKQQTVFQQFFGYWQNRTLFTIQTPWAIFQNMAILNCRAIQSGEDRTITDFEVSFKQINVASTASGPQPQLQSRLATQAAPNQVLGNNAVSPGGLSVSSAVGNL